MRIALVTVGTRGDVEPVVAIGCALAARGHAVTVATHADFADLVRSLGLEHAEIGGSVPAMLAESAPSPAFASPHAPRAHLEIPRSILARVETRLADDMPGILEGVDAVAIHALALGALAAAHRRGVPCALLAPWPIVPTEEVPPPLLRSLVGMPPAVRTAAWPPFMRSVFAEIARSKAVHGALRALPGLPVLHLFGAPLLPRPRDWPEHVGAAGFCALPEGDYAPPAELRAFLEAGPPPVYVGFGAMTATAPQRLPALAAEAARLARMRAIVSRPGSLAQEGDVLFVADVPHAWLFPKVAAVVHHAGAGTLARGLMAGRPTIVCPFFGDQPFWAEISRRLRVGPDPILGPKLTAPVLAEAMTRVGDAGFRTTAEALAARFDEDAPAHAAEWLERRLSAGR